MTACKNNYMDFPHRGGGLRPRAAVNIRRAGQFYAAFSEFFRIAQTGARRKQNAAAKTEHVYGG